MPVDVTKPLKAALARLTAEKRRIERQTAAIQEALKSLNGNIVVPRSSRVKAVPRGVKRGRRRMSAAERKAVGRRMKAYWAKRRIKEKSKKKER
jgi:hypothetical protein